MTDYSVIAITETNINVSINIAEILDTSRYCVYRCVRDYVNTHRSRVSGVCLAFDSTLSPVNFKNSADFQQLFSINIVGAKIILSHFTLFIILILPTTLHFIFYLSI